MIETFVERTIPSLLPHLSPLAYGLAFLGGVLTSLGPCNISMVPVIMGYVGGQQDLSRGRGFHLSLFFTFGTAITFVALGIIAALIHGLFGDQKALLLWAVAIVCFVIGLNLLGAVKLNFDFLTRLQPTRVTHRGPFGALLLGLVMGLAGSQCATPILAAIVVEVIGKGKVAHGALMLLAYALGRGVPIVAVGTYTGALRLLPAMERWTALAQKAAGVVIIGVGVYFIWTA